MNQKKRCIVYIDGFNLYFNLLRRKWGRFKWLDLYKFSELLIPEDHELVCVKYYTARVKGNRRKAARQQAFLSANNANPNVHIIEGVYRNNDIECDQCDHVFDVPEEKQSDVRMALGIVVDMYEDAYDTAAVITCDTDLVPAVELVGQHPSKLCHVYFAQKIMVKELDRAASESFFVFGSTLHQSQFPIEYNAPDGKKYYKPREWD